MDPYTMLGYNESKNPVVAAHVTAPEARKIARASGPTGYYLAPHRSEAPNNGGMRTYRWDPEKGDYEDWNMRAWVFTHILGPEITGTGLDGKPVEGP